MDSGTGLPADRFTDEAGKENTLKDFRGKVIYVDVWATWCGSCVAQFPHIEQLKKRLKVFGLDTMIQIIHINIDAQRGTWRRSMRKFQPDGINLHTGDTSFMEPYKLPSLPAFLLPDSTGNLLSRDMVAADDGYMDWILYSVVKGVHPLQAVQTAYRKIN